MCDNNGEKQLLNNIYHLCDKTFNSIQKITLNYIEFYNNYYKNLKLELEYLLVNEPFKIFKNKHLAWEKKVKEKEEEISKIIKKINNEVKSLSYKE